MTKVSTADDLASLVVVMVALQKAHGRLLRGGDRRQPGAKEGRKLLDLSIGRVKRILRKNGVMVRL